MTIIEKLLEADATRIREELRQEYKLTAAQVAAVPKFQEAHLLMRGVHLSLEDAMASRVLVPSQASNTPRPDQKLSDEQQEIIRANKMYADIVIGYASLLEVLDFKDEDGGKGF